MGLKRLFAVTVVLCVSASAAFGEAVSLFRDSTFQTESRALITTPQADTQTGAPSLFIGQSGSSFFAPFPERVRAGSIPDVPATLAVYQGNAVEHIRYLIGRAEAGRMGYDAVQYGARIRPSKLPTQMTIAEIYQWIDATPGQPHAIGRYQFIPPTLRRLVRKQGVPLNARFSPQVQDLLSDALLEEAGLQAISRGELGRVQFMNNLAKIWAGFPNSSGRSHYHGYAGNKATMSWAQFDAEMRKIFPG